MRGTYDKLTTPSSPYRSTILRYLERLENPENAEEMLSVIAQLAQVGSAFHDLGKAGISWQNKVRELDPGCPAGLVGRSLSTGQRIGIPHTPPGFVATVEACRLLMGGELGNAEALVRTIALASCRHHSSLFHPARIENYQFSPHQDTVEFVREMLVTLGASADVAAEAQAIVAKSQLPPEANEVPLMLPNHDLFPIYALVGRAILLSDREDAAQDALESLA